MYRQGDVLLVPVDTRPENLRYVKRKKGQKGVILAAGEATGHHHRVLEVGAREYRADSGDRYVTTGKAGGTITHEEHDPIPLPANTVFKVVQQREYAPVIKDNTIRASERQVYD
jgi:hypothetical protein